MTVNLKYLATGSEYCGSRYTSQVLTSAGVLCGHEHLFSLLGGYCEPKEPGPWGHPWSLVQAESSWPAAAHLDHPAFDGVTIVHVMRNPLRIARSKRFVTNDDLETIVSHVLTWNRMIEDGVKGRKYVRYRVEDGPYSLLDKLGIDYKGNGIFDDRTCNRHAPPDAPMIKWTDIPDSQLKYEFRAYADEWGYE